MCGIWTEFVQVLADGWEGCWLIFWWLWLVIYYMVLIVKHVWLCLFDVNQFVGVIPFVWLLDIVILIIVIIIVIVTNITLPTIITTIILTTPYTSLLLHPFHQHITNHPTNPLIHKHLLYILRHNSNISLKLLHQVWQHSLQNYIDQFQWWWIYQFLFYVQ